MSSKEVEQKIFETLMLIPTKEVVSQSQINAMQKAANLFATRMDGSVILQSIRDCIENPTKIAEIARNTGDSVIVNECEETLKMLEDAKIAEFQRMQ